MADVSFEGAPMRRGRDASFEGGLRGRKAPPFCKWKDLLGRPGEGFHSARLFGFARNDILATLGVGILLALLLKQSIITTVTLLFLTGIFFHWLFCVKGALGGPL